MSLIEMVCEQSLTHAAEAEIAALLARCFATDFGGRSFFLTRHHWRHLVRRDGRIVAHLAVQLRAVRRGGRLTTIAGIADVATDPSVRGQGLAAALLQAAIRQSRAAPVDHILLYGTARLYAGAGFRPAANPTTFVDMPGAATAAVCRSPARHLMVLDLTDVAWDGTAELDLLGPMF